MVNVNHDWSFLVKPARAGIKTQSWHLSILRSPCAHGSLYDASACKRGCILECPFEPNTNSHRRLKCKELSCPLGEVLKVSSTVRLECLVMKGNEVWLTVIVAKTQVYLDNSFPALSLSLRFSRVFNGFGMFHFAYDYVLRHIFSNKDIQILSHFLYKNIPGGCILLCACIMQICVLLYLKCLHVICI